MVKNVLASKEEVVSDDALNWGVVGGQWSGFRFCWCTSKQRLFVSAASVISSDPRNRGNFVWRRNWTPRDQTKAIFGPDISSRSITQPPIALKPPSDVTSDASIQDKSSGSAFTRFGLLTTVVCGSCDMSGEAQGGFLIGELASRFQGVVFVTHRSTRGSGSWILLAAYKVVLVHMYLYQEDLSWSAQIPSVS